MIRLKTMAAAVAILSYTLVSAQGSNYVSLASHSNLLNSLFVIVLTQGRSTTTYERGADGNVTATTRDGDGNLTGTTTYTRDPRTGDVTTTNKDKDNNETSSSTDRWNPNAKNEDTSKGPDDGNDKGTTTTYKDNRDGTYTYKTKDGNGKVVREGKGKRDARSKRIDESGTWTRYNGSDPEARGKDDKQYGPDGKPTEVDKKDKNGKKYEEVDIDGDGNRTTTPYGEDGRPGTPRRTDKNGKPLAANISMDGLGTTASMTGVVVEMPDSVAAGEPMCLSVVTMTGQVLPNQDVKVSGGPNGSFTVKTDENGVATVDVPKTWKGMSAEVLGAVAVAGVATISHSGHAPRIDNAPATVSPGNVVNIHGDNFSPKPTENTVMVGGVPAKVLGACANTITAFVPLGVPNGPTNIVVSNGAGETSAPVQTNVVSLTWDPGVSKLTAGQKITRTLRITGTQEPVWVNVVHPAGDAASVAKCGQMLSTGGANNTVNIDLVGDHAGAFSLSAQLPDANDQASNDERSARVFELNAADWRNLANNELDGAKKADLRNAASNCLQMVDAWRRAAADRRAGHTAKASRLEQSAKLRNAACSAYGASNRDDAKKFEAAALKAGAGG